VDERPDLGSGSFMWTARGYGFVWASLFALSRRFGRDDDLLVLNYMTANSDNARFPTR
jgi:intracellular multiplication protein IcmO